MAAVRDLPAVKQTQPLSIGPEGTALDAAILMNEHKIGSLVVLEGGRLTGIVTERDILQRVVAQRRDPAGTAVREIMTADPVCCRLHTAVEEARVCMMERRVRHLPVLDDQGQLCGLVSIGDLNAHEARSKDMTIHLLHEYIYGSSAAQESSA